MNNKQDITALRTTLFEVLQGVRDKSINIEEAKAVNEIAQTIINSAKIEVEHLKVYQGLGKGTDFIPVSMMEVLPGTKGGFTFKMLPKEPEKR